MAHLTVEEMRRLAKELYWRVDGVELYGADEAMWSEENGEPVEDWMFEYSGRGMYGQKCGALVVRRDVNIIELGGHLAAAAEDAGLDKIPTTTDNLGFDTVLY